MYPIDRTKWCVSLYEHRYIFLALLLWRTSCFVLLPYHPCSVLHLFCPLRPFRPSVSSAPSVQLSPRKILPLKFCSSVTLTRQIAHAHFAGAVLSLSTLLLARSYYLLLVSTCIPSPSSSRVDRATPLDCFALRSPVEIVDRLHVNEASTTLDTSIKCATHLVVDHS